jgi:hypothetical protein
MTAFKSLKTVLFQWSKLTPVSINHPTDKWRKWFLWFFIHLKFWHFDKSCRFKRFLFWSYLRCNVAHILFRLWNFLNDLKLSYFNESSLLQFLLITQLTNDARGSFDSSYTLSFDIMINHGHFWDSCFFLFKMLYGTHTFWLWQLLNH